MQKMVEHCAKPAFVHIKHKPSQMNFRRNSRGILSVGNNFYGIQ